jgi:uncharacterized protein (TIGR02246 family)
MENQKALVQTIYKQLLESWNSHNADAYSNLFADDGFVVGFDGSEMHGREDIQKQLQQIFNDHHVSSYVTIVRDIRQWSPHIFMLTATVGMISPGDPSVNPKVNAIQSMVVSLEHKPGKILMFQNTPAAYHGRPEKAGQLTKELDTAAVSLH